jgi:hypothetical protein
MVINDLDLVDISLSPGEANPPLVIDPDIMLPLAVAFQSLKPVAWRNLQVLEKFGAMEIQELPPRDSLKVPKARDIQVSKQNFSVPGSKGANHASSVYYVSRYRSTSHVSLRQPG